MRDAYNPTPEEVLHWARTPGSPEPVEDWDLVLEDLPCEGLYLQLAADEGCSKRRYFLALLHLIVGDAVRTGFRTRPEPAVEDLLERSRALAHPDLDAWRQRSRELLRNPQTFDYDAWCAGGLARDGA